MIRPMRDSDWKYVAEIYQQGIDSGIATFTTICPSFEEWDRYHHRNCRFVYDKTEKLSPGSLSALHQAEKYTAEALK